MREKSIFRTAHLNAERILNTNTRAVQCLLVLTKMNEMDTGTANIERRKQLMCVCL